MYDIQYERELGILSHFMFEPELCDTYCTKNSILKKEYFSNKNTRAAFERLCFLTERRDYIDETTLISEKDGLTQEFVLQILGTNPIVYVEGYIKDIKENYLRKKLSSELSKVAHKLNDDDDEYSYLDAVKQIEQMTADTGNLGSSLKSFSELADLCEGEEILPILETGVDFLDSSFQGGFECGQLVLISGEADAGKTALGIQILKHISKSEPVVFFAFEFTLRKFITAQKEIEGQNWRNDNLFIETENNDLDMVLYTIKKAHKEKGARFFLIDSQMRLACNIEGNEERNETWKFFTLATLARQLEIIIVLIVQTSKKDPNTPIGSKKANHEADIFIRIEHEKSEDKTKPYSTTSRRVSIMKNKQNGHIFSLQVGFNGFLRSFFAEKPEKPKQTFVDAPHITIDFV